MAAGRRIPPPANAIPLSLPEGCVELDPSAPPFVRSDDPRWWQVIPDRAHPRIIDMDGVGGSAGQRAVLPPEVFDPRARTVPPPRGAPTLPDPPAGQLVSPHQALKVSAAFGRRPGQIVVREARGKTSAPSELSFTSDKVVLTSFEDGSKIEAAFNNGAWCVTDDAAWGYIVYAYDDELKLLRIPSGSGASPSPEEYTLVDEEDVGDLVAAASGSAPTLVQFGPPTAAVTGSETLYVTFPVRVDGLYSRLVFVQVGALHAPALEILGSPVGVFFSVTTSLIDDGSWETIERPSLSTSDGTFPYHVVYSASASDGSSAIIHQTPFIWGWLRSTVAEGTTGSVVLLPSVASAGDVAVVTWKEESSTNRVVVRSLSASVSDWFWTDAVYLGVTPSFDPVTFVTSDGTFRVGFFTNNDIGLSWNVDPLGAPEDWETNSDLFYDTAADRAELAQNRFVHAATGGEYVALMWEGTTAYGTYQLTMAGTAAEQDVGDQLELGTRDPSMGDIADGAVEWITGTAWVPDQDFANQGLIELTTSLVVSGSPITPSDLIGLWVVLGEPSSGKDPTWAGRYVVVDADYGSSVPITIVARLALPDVSGAFVPAFDSHLRPEGTFTFTAYSSMRFLSQPAIALDANRYVHLIWLESSVEDRTAWSGVTVDLCYRRGRAKTEGEYTIIDREVAERLLGSELSP